MISARLDTYQFENKDSRQTPGIVQFPVPISAGTSDTAVYSYADLYQNPWMYICIHKIASAVASIPLKVYERIITESAGGDKEVLQEQFVREIYGHRLTRLMKKINPFMSAFEFWGEIVSNMYLFGIAYAEAVFDGNNLIKELWPVDPRYMWIIPDRQKKIAGYEFRCNGYSAKFSPREIIQFKFYHPTDKFFGFAPARTAKRRAITDEKGHLFRESYFDNGALIGAVVQTDQELNNDQYDRIEKHFKKNYVGANKAHRLAILESGLKLTKMEETFDNMQYVQGQVHSGRQICAIMNMPPSLVGIDENVPAKGKEIDLKLLYQETVLPMLRLLAGKVNEFFFSDNQYNNPTYERFAAFDTSQVPALRDDIETLSRVVARVVDRGVMTINEVRAKFFGLASVPWGNTFFVPLNTNVWSPDSQADRLAGDAPGTDPNASRSAKKPAPNKYHELVETWLTEAKSNKSLNPSNTLVHKLVY